MQASLSNFFVGAPWSTQAVVEWMTSVQLELLRSGRSKRMTEQLTDKAVDKVVSSDEAAQHGSYAGAHGDNGDGLSLRQSAAASK